MKSMYTLVLLSLHIASCRHYPITSPNLYMETPMLNIDYSVDTLNCNGCTEIPLPPIQLNYKQIDYQPIAPLLRGLGVHPNNQAEIVYTKIVWGQAVMSTFVYNQHTKENKKIDDGIVDGCPRWHSNNWILLAKRDAIYKTKSTGERLSKLIDYESNTGCTWNQEGTQFAFYPYPNNSLLHIADLKTLNITDSLAGEPAFYSFFDWQHPFFFTRQRSDGSIIGLNVHNRTRQQLVDAKGSPTGFCWLNDSTTMIVTTMQGLFITNTMTKQIKKIRCACGTSYYKYPIYSPQEHKIFAIKVISHSANSPMNTVVQTSTQLVKMNIDGKNEVIIDIPQ